MPTMIALFDSKEARDSAVKEAAEVRYIDVQYIGEATPVLNGKPTTATPRPMVLFHGDGASAAVLFLRHGAVNCDQA